MAVLSSVSFLRRPDWSQSCSWKRCVLPGPASQERPRLLEALEVTHRPDTAAGSDHTHTHTHSENTEVPSHFRSPPCLKAPLPGVCLSPQCVQSR